MANMSPRMERVADQLQRELAVLIQQEVKDPRLGMVSVTGVTVSRDLSYADVYVTAMDQVITGREYRPAAAGSEDASKAVSGESGKTTAEPQETSGDAGTREALEAEGGEQHRQALKILNGAAGFLRSLLGKRLSLRVVPRLRFHYDESIARGRYLSSLIDSAVAADKERQ